MPPSAELKYEPSKKPPVPRPGQVILGSVVAAKHDDGVVGDAEFVELVEQHAEVVVQHQQAVAPIAVGALAPTNSSRGIIGKCISE